MNLFNQSRWNKLLLHFYIFYFFLLFLLHNLFVPPTHVSLRGYSLFWVFIFNIQSEVTVYFTGSFIINRKSGRNTFMNARQGVRSRMLQPAVKVGHIRLFTKHDGCNRITQQKASSRLSRRRSWNCWFVFEVGNFRVRTRVIAESCQLQQAAGAQYLQL